MDTIGQFYTKRNRTNLTPIKKAESNESNTIKKSGVDWTIIDIDWTPIEVEWHTIEDRWKDTNTEWIW